MQIFKPVETVEDFHTLDESEVLCGYLDGLKGSECLLGGVSRSYWHGWRNGLVDGGIVEADRAQLKLDKAFQALREIDDGDEPAAAMRA